ALEVAELALADVLVDLEAGRDAVGADVDVRRILVDGAVAVVIAVVAELGRAAGAADAHDVAADALERAAAARAGRAGVADRRAEIGGLVDLTVAVVVEAVAHLDAGREVRRVAHRAAGAVAYDLARRE